MPTSSRFTYWCGWALVGETTARRYLVWHATCLSDHSFRLQIFFHANSPFLLNNLSPCFLPTFLFSSHFSSALLIAPFITYLAFSRHLRWPRAHDSSFFPSRSCCEPMETGGFCDVSWASHVDEGGEKRGMIHTWRVDERVPRRFRLSAYAS